MYITRRTLLLWTSLLLGLFLLLTYGVLTDAHWLQAMDHFGQVSLRTQVTANKTTVLAYVTDVLGI